MTAVATKKLVWYLSTHKTSSFSKINFKHERPEVIRKSNLKVIQPLSGINEAETLAALSPFSSSNFLKASI